MTKIKLLKLFDRIIGRALLFFLHETKSITGSIPGQIKRIIFIRPGGIGDAVLLLPAINILKRAFPETEIDVLCEKRNASVFELSGGMRRIYKYDKGLELFRCLRNRYDVVIDTEQWHRLSAFIAFIVGGNIRIGFDTNERRKAFTHKIPYSHDDYEIYSFFHLIKPLVSEMPTFDLKKPFISISGEVSNTLLPLAPEHKDRVIAIFPGATVPERRWGSDRFGQVARKMSEQGYKVVILGSRIDAKDAKEIREYAEGSIDLTGKTSLVDVASILKMSRLLLTADSGIMHMSFALGTPTISLFGAGIEKKWTPRGERDRVISKDIDCSPCTQFGYTPRCKRKVKCLSSITVDEVIKAMEVILK
ncbi:MAG: glycosyltransferase family 9 protein [Candidatus Omnitrophica bacterium]|nr:glycosyltransferase family 9 protein [Candidatus Omnitrophota bacterium]